MRLEARTSTTYRLTVHAYELAALISAARWAAEGGAGELTAEARDGLQALVADYETELDRLSRPPH